MRASIDVDVYREGARDVVEQELREAAAKDVGDWFRSKSARGSLSQTAPPACGSPSVQHGYRVYPLVDHVADKVVATFEVHGETQRPSTHTATSSISYRS